MCNGIINRAKYAAIITKRLALKAIVWKLIRESSWCFYLQIYNMKNIQILLRQQWRHGHWMLTDSTKHSLCDNSASHSPSLSHRKLFLSGGHWDWALENLMVSVFLSLSSHSKLFSQEKQMVHKSSSIVKEARARCHMGKWSQRLYLNN